MTILDLATVCLMGLGGGFFVAGTVGLLRFPDTHSRLHALTKADNLGLGLVTAGLVLQAEAAAVAVKLLVTWVLVLVASGTSSYLIAHEALAAGSPADDRADDARADP